MMRDERTQMGPADATLARAGSAENLDSLPEPPTSDEPMRTEELRDWLVQALGIQRYPSTLIAGSDGTIRANHTGYVDAVQMSADLRRVLEETPAVAQAQTP